MWTQLSGEMRGGQHVFLPVRIYYEDTDFSGVVYHASYLRFMERGRTEYMRAVGAEHRGLFEGSSPNEAGYAFMVRAMEIDFLKPAKMDDVVEVCTAPCEVKGASVTLPTESVRRGSELLVAAGYGWPSSPVSGHAPFPRALREVLQADRDAVGKPRPSG